MLMAGLLELLSDSEKQAFLSRMNGLHIPGVRFDAELSTKCGINGTHVSVTVDGEEEESLDTGHACAYGEQHSHGEDGHTHPHGHDHVKEHEHSHEEHAHEHSHSHHHSGLHDIEHLVYHLDLSEKVRGDVLAVYQLIAEAESHAHGRPIDQIHFHEVGTMDAVADIVGVCTLMELLAPETVLASPIHVGSGQVHCAHGILPVPAPATAYILRGVPTYGGAVRGELCTPTGAALLRHFVSSFGDMPVMKTSKIGYGMGKKDFEAANCVRVLLGESGGDSGEIVELRCNLDDMTPEAVGYAFERLFEGGALDVYTTPVGMKKNRPGILLSCMCPLALREEMLRLLFRHTTTLGVREYVCKRYTLARSERSQETPYGPVRMKRASGWDVEREKPEFEDVARLAREQGKSLREITDLLGK